MKINVTMNDDLYERMVEYSERNYMNKSQLISVALTDYLNAKQMLNAITDMSVAMTKIADSNEIDEESKQELEKFQLLSSMFSLKK